MRRRSWDKVEVDDVKENEKVYLQWTDYKTIRQYQTMGDVLDDLRVHGYENLTEHFYGSEKEENNTRNGHMWLTMEP